MCTPACMQFAETSLSSPDVCGKAVLEVGARDFNGSMRGPIAKMEPASYTAVDLFPGPGVDVVCDAERLVDQFGRETFDVVISTEMLEHVRSWQAVVSNLKGVLRPGGILILTTRSRGFPFHGYPGDFWRFEQQDFRDIFSDLSIDRLESDVATAPGVFLRATRPVDFDERDLEALRMYSIVRRRRAATVTALDVAASTGIATGMKTLRQILPDQVTSRLRRSAWSARCGH